MIAPDYPFLDKAMESLIGAESEFLNSRYNNCANRCYYACFQAAIVALQEAGIAPRGTTGQWSHAFVPAQFEGMLINRRKLYPTQLRGTLGHLYGLRQTADYDEDPVTQTEANRALRRTRTFVQAMQERGGENR
ncbi:MAG TPA: HEPN domain-containing protein [Gammaproteobacteria bacterium]|nr:HEPN domain-containing protein [Gammaproteobacteria bacterium]